MSAFYILAAIGFQVFSVFMFKQEHQLTNNKARILLGIAGMIASCLLLNGEFGILAGLIIATAMFGLIGMLFPLFKPAKS